VQDPVIPGVGLEAVEDPVVVQTEQVPRVEQEPRRASGGLLGESCPGGEVLTVVRPGRAVVAEPLVWMAAHGEAPTAGPRRHWSAAGDSLAGSERAKSIGPAVLQLDIPQEPAQRSLSGVAGYRVNEALAIDERQLAACGDLALTQEKHQVRIVVAELRVTVDVQLECHAGVAVPALGYRTAVGVVVRGGAGGRLVDEQAGPEDVPGAGEHACGVGAVGSEDDRAIAGP
jgi:hypothetical protein